MPRKALDLVAVSRSWAAERPGKAATANAATAATMMKRLYITSSFAYEAGPRPGSTPGRCPHVVTHFHLCFAHPAASKFAKPQPSARDRNQLPFAPAHDGSRLNNKFELPR